MDLAQPVGFATEWVSTRSGSQPDCCWLRASSPNFSLRTESAQLSVDDPFSIHLGLFFFLYILGVQGPKVAVSGSMSQARSCPTVAITTTKRSASYPAYAKPYVRPASVGAFGRQRSVPSALSITRFLGPLSLMDSTTIKADRSLSSTTELRRCVHFFSNCPVSEVHLTQFSASATKLNIGMESPSEWVKADQAESRMPGPNSSRFELDSPRLDTSPHRILAAPQIPIESEPPRESRTAVHRRPEA